MFPTAMINCDDEVPVASPADDVHRVVIATMLREEGNTGVHTHVRELRRYLDESGPRATLVTPFSWGRALSVPVFGLRLPLERCNRPASVAWYRYWHQLFLERALRRELATVDDCAVYVQCPLAAKAALRARLSPRQRVVMAAHLRISQADEWANKELIKYGGTMFQAIRRLERDVIPQVDGLVFVSSWAKKALLSWLPEAANVPSAVIDNFVAPLTARPEQPPIGDLVTTGHLEPVKNHRFLLEVLASAKQMGRCYTLDVFGEGPLRKDLIQMTDSLALEGQVRFHGFRPNVREFLPCYRAYVHASYFESSSLAIIEAMAAGLPIVTGNIGPLSELCDDGIEARFWPLGDPRQAAGMLINFLDDEETRSMAARAAYERYVRNFAASVVAPKLKSFLLGTLPRDTFGHCGPPAKIAAS